MDGSKAEGDLVLIQTFFVMEIVLKKYYLASEQLDLDNKSGSFVSKQGHTQPRFHP